ncbi:MAG TPA: hypothetical protein VEF76_07305 [Patescibacteria group bacterium]|nr:hypothetical protein [Patescibacteria group bacterium]
MAKRVSADTITQITGAPGFGEQKTPIPPAPTADDLIEKTRLRLSKEVLAAQAWLDAADPENERTIEQRRKDVKQATENQQMFEDLLNDVPHGFKLVPTFYSRITTDENNAIKQEYSYSVRPRFLKFLGENYADDLRALGIPDAGIERMKGGLDPSDGKGTYYRLNVDHIVERAGSGMMGKTRSPDPDNGNRVTYDVNHLGNFVLLPEQVHEYKNKLNDLQVASDMPFQKGKWILMMVPERNEQHHGFVAQPQPKGSPLEGLQKKPLVIYHAQYVASTMTQEIAELKRLAPVRAVVRDFIDAAEAEKTTVAELADAQARQKKGGLRKAFNDAVAKDPAASDFVNGLVRPGIEDLTYSVAALYRKTTQSLERPFEKDAFFDLLRFYQSEEVRNLRADIAALPVPEAAEMVSTFRQLDADFNRVATQLRDADRVRRAANPVNDNDDKKQFRKNNFRKGNDGSRVKKPGTR